MRRSSPTGVGARSGSDRRISCQPPRCAGRSAQPVWPALACVAVAVLRFAFSPLCLPIVGVALVLILPAAVATARFPPQPCLAHCRTPFPSSQVVVPPPQAHAHVVLCPGTTTHTYTHSPTQPLHTCCAAAPPALHQLHASPTSTPPVLFFSILQPVEPARTRKNQPTCVHYLHTLCHPLPT